MSTVINYLFAVQDPFTDGLVDDNDRAKWIVNFQFNTADSGTVEDDIATHIVNNSLGTKNVDMFKGPRAVLPSPEIQDPVVTIINTGGASPQRSQNGGTLHNGSLQIAVRSINYTTAKVRIDAIWNLLDSITNTTLP